MSSGPQLSAYHVCCAIFAQGYPRELGSPLCPAAMVVGPMPRAPRVFQSALSKQRVSRLVKHQFAAKARGGRRAIACHQGRSLGKHGGHRRLVSHGQRTPCRFCGCPRASQLHEASCSCQWGGPAVLTTGLPVRHPVVTACGCPAEILALVMRIHSVGSTVWQPSSCRVAHQGTMQAWGWCTRYAKPYQCWDSLLEPVTQLIQHLWHELPPDVAQFVRRRAADTQLHKKDVAGRPGGPCAFLGKCYVPSAPSQRHGPPMAVARALSGRVAEPGCHSRCKTCATVGCLSCPSCPLHVDGHNQSWTLLVLYQARRTPWEHRAWFVAGDTALDIRGGLVVHSMVGQLSRSRAPW